MSRLSKTFTTKKSALIPFIMAGDPDLATTAKLLPALVEAGADIIELGMPFSDPVADGAVIQAAGLRALKNGTTLTKLLECVSTFRKSNDTTPLVLMGYYNPVHHYGAEKFCKDAAAVGVDGVILVDLPPEEEAEFTVHARKSGIAFVRLIAPTSVPARLPLLLKKAEGFVYYISVTGITGAGAAQTSDVSAAVQQIRAAMKQAGKDLPIAVGFGVKTRAQVQEIGVFADAVVVGSALVDTLANAKDVVAEAKSFIKSLL